MKKFPNILVAFDLNKTLFYKSDKSLQRKHDKKIRNLYFYFRPYLGQLIQFLHGNKINYCFWSNMMGKNCIKYVKQLQLVGMSKHCGIFDQDFCDQLHNNTDQIKIKSIKNLHKLAKSFNIDVDHCILVDDSIQKNVKGCHMIQVTQFQGQQQDKQILNVIEKLKEFRQSRVSELIADIPLLNYTKYKLFQKMPIPQAKQQKKYQPKQKAQLTQSQILIQSNPQLIKLKSDLIVIKQQKDRFAQELKLIQQENIRNADDVKRKSQGKVINKGGELLMEVLMFAKIKKANQYKVIHIKQKLNNCNEKITIIKTLMQNIISKHKFSNKQQHYKQQTNQQKQQTNQHKKQVKQHKKKVNQHNLHQGKIQSNQLNKQYKNELKKQNNNEQKRQQTHQNKKQKINEEKTQQYTKNGQIKYQNQAKPSNKRKRKTKNKKEQQNTQKQETNEGQTSAQITQKSQVQQVFKK